MIETKIINLKFLVLRKLFGAILVCTCQFERCDHYLVSFLGEKGL